MFCSARLVMSALFMVIVVTVADLSVYAEDGLTAALESKIDPGYRLGPVYVIGRVNKPGEYLIGHYTDVLQVLSLAGGLTPFAAENDIKVMRRVRGEQHAIPFRYGDVRKGRDLEQNIILQRGDVVMVP